MTRADEMNEWKCGMVLIRLGMCGIRIGDAQHLIETLYFCLCYSFYTWGV
jgi:hypothetical protein